MLNSKLLPVVTLINVGGFTRDSYFFFHILFKCSQHTHIYNTFVLKIIYAKAITKMIYYIKQSGT